MRSFGDVTGMPVEVEGTVVEWVGNRTYILQHTRIGGSLRFIITTPR
jgi:hypothetical protein